MQSILRSTCWLLAFTALGCGVDEVLAPAGGLAGAAGAGGHGGAKADPCALSTAPESLEVGGTMPDLALTTAQGTVQLRSLRRGCDAPGVLLVRVEPASCAPCGRLGASLPETLSPFPAGSVDVVTVLYADENGAPPAGETAATWAARFPTLPGAKAASAAAAAWVEPSGVVPLHVVVDRRTLRISAVLDAMPGASWIRMSVRDALAEAGAGKVTLPPDPPLVDERWDAHTWAEIQEMARPLEPPPDPTNAVGDDPAAAALGAQLFAEPKFGSQLVSCVTCHDPQKGFADGLQTGKGVGIGKLNTPAATTAAWSRFQFWDGRADTVWSQALGPIENPIEIGGTRLEVAHRVKESYATSYEELFGPLPDLSDYQRFPIKGMPGDPPWEAMAPTDQAAVDRIFVNVGKAIAAHERTLRPPTTRLESYAKGDFGALSEEEKRGLGAFFSAGCVACHHGPTLENGAFHDILMPSSDPAGPADPGRVEGVKTLLASPFRGDGAFSDDPAFGAKKLAGLTSKDALVGQQKTPTLRGVSQTGPWGHGGTFTTLESVMVHYGRPDLTKLTGPAYSGTRDVALPRFSADHDAGLVALMRVFSGE